MRSNPRRRAREFVLQGLYQRRLSGNAVPAIRAQLSDAGGFALADQMYFDELWAGVTAEEDALIESITPWLDRNASGLSPIERAILVIGTWELKHRLEIPLAQRTAEIRARKRHDRARADVNAARRAAGARRPTGSPAMGAVDNRGRSGRDRRR